MNHKPDNINKFLNVFRSPLKILGLLSIVLLLASIVTAWTYTNPPRVDCFDNGTCVNGNTKWNETSYTAESFYATSNITAGYHNTTDGKQLQNGCVGAGYSYCIQLNGSTVEAIDKNGSRVYTGTVTSVMNNLYTSGAGIVRFSAGNFTTATSSATSYIPGGMTVEGEGNATEIFLAADSNIFQADNGSHITIRNLAFNCNYRARKAVYLQNVSNSTIDNVDVRACLQIPSALQLYNATDSKIINSRLFDTAEGINIAGNRSGAVGNTVINATGDNFITLGVTAFRSYDLYAYDNIMMGPGDGLVLWNTERSKAERNIFTNVERGVILMRNSTNNTIANNQVDITTDTANKGGIQIDAGSDGNNVFNNVIMRTWVGGIQVVANRTIVKGNIVSYNGQDGMLVQDSSNNTIEGNECYNNNNRNSATPSGIRIVNVTNSTIKNNHCWDDRATKLQKYGITLSGVLDLNNRVEGNDVQWGGVTGNINVPSTSLRIQNYGAAGYNHGTKSDCTTITAFGEGDSCYNTTRHLEMNWNGTFWVLYNETRP